MWRYANQWYDKQPRPYLTTPTPDYDTDTYNRVTYSTIQVVVGAFRLLINQTLPEYPYGVQPSV